MTKTIAFDLASGVPRKGGDAYAVALKGLLAFHRRNPDMHFLLCGDAVKINIWLNLHHSLKKVCKVQPATRVINMDATPSEAWKNRAETSMWEAVQAVKEGRADAVMSAGNTGAYVRMLMALGRIAGTEPAFVTRWPVRGGGSVSFGDAGAYKNGVTVDVLVGHALKAVAVAKVREGIETPKVAILNIGTEEDKGDPVLHQTAEVLITLAEETGLFEYVGFMEANNIGKGDADVVVTDGTTGNHVTKAAEGTVAQVKDIIFDELNRRPLLKYTIGALVYVFARGLIRKLKPDLYNGAIVVGFKGLAVKIHGDSARLGYEIGLEVAALAARLDLVNQVTAKLQYMPNRKAAA